MRCRKNLLRTSGFLLLLWPIIHKQLTTFLKHRSAGCLPRTSTLSLVYKESWPWLQLCHGLRSYSHLLFPHSRQLLQLPTAFLCRGICDRVTLPQASRSARWGSVVNPGLDHHMWHSQSLLGNYILYFSVINPRQSNVWNPNKSKITFFHSLFKYQIECF